MKGVILAGGFGTRLRPLTEVTNKHLLPVYDRPMVLYPLKTLVESGVRDVLIVSEGIHLHQFRDLFQGGEQYGAKLSYAAQKGAGGIAEALSLARDFAGGDAVAVILGDNIFERNFRDDLLAFSGGARVFLKEVSDPHRFGVPVFSSTAISRVEEKPTEPKSKFAITGFYVFDNGVFDIVKKLSPSKRGELEITDAVNAYATQGTLTHGLVEGFWTDAGTFESLLEASNWAAGQSGRRVKNV